MASDSRADILGRLRGAVSRQVAEHAAHRPRAVMSAIETQALFIERLGAARGTVERLKSLDQVPDAVARYLAGQNLPARVTLAPGVAAKLDFSSGALATDTDLPLEDGIAVLTGCIAGVAETGTFVAASGADIDPRLNYLAETLIVLVGGGQIMPAYEDVWTMLRVRTGLEAPRLVSFITGPSRTADIEQTIEWGAHGPRRLHVLISEEMP